MRPEGATGRLSPIPRFLLHHRHEPHDCGAAFAAFRGHASPLRHRATAASCRWGGHEVWWTVEAQGAQEALGLLPHFVAERTTATGRAPQFADERSRVKGGVPVQTRATLATDEPEECGSLSAEASFAKAKQASEVARTRALVARPAQASWDT
jgi:hypothetical protein